MNVEPTSAPGRVEVLTARVLRSITLPLVVAVVGAVLMVASISNASADRKVMRKTPKVVSRYCSEILAMFLACPFD